MTTICTVCGNDNFNSITIIYNISKTRMIVECTKCLNRFSESTSIDINKDGRTIFDVKLKDIEPHMKWKDLYDE